MAVKRKWMECAKAVLRRMVMYQNGQDPADVKYMHVRGSTMYNFAVFVISSPVQG